MKIAQLILIFAFPFTLFGQATKQYTKLLKKNDSLGIQVIRTGNALKTDYYLVSNKTDSILFHSINREFYSDASVYEGMTIDKPIQLDNRGKEEILIYYVLNGAPVRSEDNKTLFIINLDTKEKIFEGKYYYSNSERRTQVIYNITFDADLNLVVDYNKYYCFETPDHKEGIYSLADGKYKWIKSKYIYTRKTIARDDSSGIHITVISRCENHLEEYFLFYNNDRDSIKFLHYISCIEESASSNRESCKIKTMQLDKKGRPEVIVEYSNSSSSSSSSEMIIFNLDAGEIIFRADHNFFAMYEGEQVAKCKGYSSTIEIQESGAIRVTYPANNCMDPGLKEGIYVIEKGKYTWLKTK